MISKKNRLKEKEVKKVLKKAKPFFSYGIVLNYMKNNLARNRFAIIIGSKSVKTNVVRNYFRRLFYDLVRLNNKIDDNIISGTDFVFVVKKQTKLDMKDKMSINSFKNDINFLLNKKIK